MISLFTSLSHYLVLQIFSRTVHSTKNPPNPPNIPSTQHDMLLLFFHTSFKQMDSLFILSIFIFLQFSFHFTVDSNFSLQRRMLELIQQARLPTLYFLQSLQSCLLLPPYSTRNWNDQDRILLRELNEEKQNRQGHVLGDNGVGGKHDYGRKMGRRLGIPYL